MPLAHLKTKHLVRFCPHSDLNPMLCFVFSWYDITSSAAPAAERRVEALHLIRQYYAFVLNAVSAQTKVLKNSDVQTYGIVVHGTAM